MTQPKNTSQKHGNDFENLMKTAHMFNGACNISRSGVAINDIEGKCDLKFGLITSVKVVKRGSWIGLADATRFFEINSPRRFIIGEWEQAEEEAKEFDLIHELIAPLSLIKKMRGSLRADQVRDFHMRIAECPYGKAGAITARAIRDEILASIKGLTGILRFDFKIDDYQERRLQLSVKLEDLIALTKDKGEYCANGYNQKFYTLHEKRFCQYPLPITILSPQRLIVPRQQPLTVSKPEMLFDAPEQVETPSRAINPAARRAPVRRDDVEASKGMDKDLQDKLFG